MRKIPIYTSGWRRSIRDKPSIKVHPKWELREQREEVGSQIGGKVEVAA